MNCTLAPEMSIYSMTTRTIYLLIILLVSYTLMEIYLSAEDGLSASNFVSILFGLCLLITARAASKRAKASKSKLLIIPTVIASLACTTALTIILQLIFFVSADIDFLGMIEHDGVIILVLASSIAFAPTCWLMLRRSQSRNIDNQSD